MPSRRDLANAVRALAMDAVQRANSGHPGMPMGMADIAEVLWNDHHRHDPADPEWFDRDRFVLSNGHGSMLLYALLHLSGYALPLPGAEELPPAPLDDPGPSRVRRRPRRRDHDGTARPGPRERGRDGHRGEGPRRALQPRRTCRRRPPHVGVPRRRLPDGGDLARGVLARRHAGSRQADRVLRRQRRLHRRERRGMVHRRHAGPVRRLRLARGARCERPRPRRDRRRHSRGARGRRPPVAPVLQDGDRLRCADQGGQGVRARCAPRRRRDRRRARSSGLAAPAFRGPRRRLRGLGRPATRRRATRRVGGAARGLERRVSAGGGGIRTADGGRAAPGLGGGVCAPRRSRRGRGREHRLAQGVAERPGSTRADTARADRRLCRPHRVEPHEVERLPRC